MYSFEYRNPVKIIFGAGSISKIANEIPKTAKVLITYGGGSIMKNGVYEQVKQALKGYETYEFGGIEANPEFETLMKAANVVKEKNIDFLLAVGGGSVLDGTKFIAAAAKYEGEDAWDILAKGAPITCSVPLAGVLTLPATGSEMNMGAVVSRRELKMKLAFLHPLSYPQFSILDPNVMESLPKRQKANGVVDAYIHVLEQYLTFPNEASIQDHWAEGVLKTLLCYGERYVLEDFDYDVAANVMWAATSALNGIIGLGVPHDWATHMIGHEITALHGLDHAQTLAVVMPGMMRIMFEAKEEKIRRFARNVYNISNEEFSVELVIEKTEKFFQSLGVKTKLSEYDIKEEDIPAIIENLAKGNEIKLGEKGLVTAEKVEMILKSQL
ncbi:MULTISPECIES: iron-containing alcohol dehydrogenase [unclassified Lentimicrobium]|uniref:iron-containing alcohol dehydrogenase n=1 Tax=unclassified Lentimicrobium TaxID=2677434 RepID=UPI001551663B|nr:MULTISPECIES: iron-containing alcohol dehydrogenase [unclassified Lentimicrobium]NPD47699.1 iron-containing alcohol dehydrogenase [Lentimicrobium sp. S6]NPD83883.1 iron-containing alcohol dehydrogenase [Lentimicrobium sp. L6]